MARVAATLIALSLTGCFVSRGGLAVPDGSAPTDGDAIDASAIDGGSLPDLGVVDLGHPPPDTGPPGCAMPELCNGIDDDCNPMTADGVGDPQFGMACDGPDVDTCNEGTTGCAHGILTCSDTTSDSPELCNGVDDDCDGMIDEAGAIGGTMSWADADHDGYGDAALPTVACSTPAGNVANGDDCNDADATVHPGVPDLCNGRDENCSGLIDDDMPCGCPIARYGAHAYLFCNDMMTWTAGEAACASVGYHLATMDDAAENIWVSTTARGANDTDWWLGATDTTTEGTWIWSSGLTSFSPHWHTGQPNGGAGQNCVATNQWHDETWNDLDCGGTLFPRVCEAGP